MITPRHAWKDVTPEEMYLHEGLYRRVSRREKVMSWWLGGHVGAGTVTDIDVAGLGGLGEYIQCWGQNLRSHQELRARLKGRSLSHCELKSRMRGLNTRDVVPPRRWERRWECGRVRGSKSTWAQCLSDHIRQNCRPGSASAKHPAPVPPSSLSRRAWGSKPPDGAGRRPQKKKRKEKGCKIALG